MADVTFHVGEKFPSHTALEDKIDRYQSANSVQLYRRNSRTLAVGRRRCPKKNFNDDIKYIEVSYACIHGGKDFKARGDGNRNQG